MALCDRQKTVWGYDELLYFGIIYNDFAGGSSHLFCIPLFIILSKIVFHDSTARFDHSL